jgi:hypothetical protein
VSVIKLDKFGGMYPVVQTHLLPPVNASYSRDAFLYNGSLVPWRLPKELRTLTNANAKKVYRIPQNLVATGITDLSYWLEFDDADTDVLRAPVIDDTHKRYYYASPSVRPKYNTTARIALGQSPWYLGVPAPSVAPGVTPAVGAGTVVSRTYVYTWVSAYGEEGPPSPPTNTNGSNAVNWDITLTAADANDLGVNRNLTKVRIYRTITATSGATTYFFVAEQDITDTTYTDAATDAVIALNNQLQSTTWSGPPVDLQGMVQMANGVFAGFRENEVWFTEPFRPHAWPPQYTLAVEFPIVGLGVVGQTLVVCTKSYPARVSGTHPASFTISHITYPEPCVSRGSIVSTGEGVYYTSPNGVVLITPTSALNVTENWVSRHKWVALSGLWAALPIRAVRLGLCYFAFAMGAAAGAYTGWTVDLTTKEPSPVMFGHLTQPRGENKNLYMDPWTGIALTIQGGKMWYYDLTDDYAERQPYLWISKYFIHDKPVNYTAMSVYFLVPETSAGVPIVTPGARNTNDPQTLGASQYGLLRVYVYRPENAGRTLLCTREIRTSGELLRIYSGQMADVWQIEIEGRVAVDYFAMATTVRELSRV